MLTAHDRVAILLHEGLQNSKGKTGISLLRYSDIPIVAVIDQESVGKSLLELTGIDRDVPIVESIADALPHQPLRRRITRRMAARSQTGDRSGIVNRQWVAYPDGNRSGSDCFVATRAMDLGCATRANRTDGGKCSSAIALVFAGVDGGHRHERWQNVYQFRA
jgi:hypothetical protein